VSDRQTDKQTDGRAIAYDIGRPAYILSRAKNEKSHKTLYFNDI